MLGCYLHTGKNPASTNVWLLLAHRLQVPWPQQAFCCYLRINVTTSNLAPTCSFPSYFQACIVNNPQIMDNHLETLHILHGFKLNYLKRGSIVAILISIWYNKKWHTVNRANQKHMTIHYLKIFFHQFLYSTYINFVHTKLKFSNFFK